MPSLDFRSELLRHDELLGRDDVLAAIGAELGRTGVDRGWVVVTAGPGVGKSAILTAYLRARGIDKTPHHFLRRDVSGWGDAHEIRASFTAKLDAQFPGVLSEKVVAEGKLLEALMDVSKVVLAPKGERLVLVIDGLDEASVRQAGENPLPSFLPHALPAGVFVLCSSRPTYPHLPWLLSREPMPLHVNLDGAAWRGSNDAAVRAYWERHGQGLAPDVREAAVRKARGNMLHAVMWRAQIERDPSCAADPGRIPDGFEAFLERLWDGLVTAPSGAGDAAIAGMKILSAAREALPLWAVAKVAGWDKPSQARLFEAAARPLLLEEPGDWHDGEKRYRPFHESFPELTRKKLGEREMRKTHARLLETIAAWPSEGESRLEHDYALGHSVAHGLAAGKREDVERLCLDTGYLEAKCRALGVRALEVELERAAALLGSKELSDVHRAVRAESHWLRQAPEALRGLLYNRLRCAGWEAESIVQRIQWEGGLPAIRLRHPVSLGGEERVLAGHVSVIEACAVTPDGRRAVSGSWDKTLRVWDVETGEALRVLKGHARAVTACAITPDGRRAVSGSEDETLRVWDLETGEVLRVLEGHTGDVTACAITPDGRLAVSGSQDETLRVWDLETGEALRVLEGHARTVTACAITPDGRLAVSGSEDTKLRVWDLETGEALRVLEGHARAVTACAITPDGRLAVSGSEDTKLRVWGLEAGEALRVFEGHAGSVLACAVTPDGRRAVSASRDDTLRVWDVKTGEALRVLEGQTCEVQAFSLTPDGRRAVSSSFNRTMRIWDLETGEALRVPGRHMESVEPGTVTRDGCRAVSGSFDGIRVWDLETGRSLRTLEVPFFFRGACAATGDGRRAVSGSSDGTVRVWDTETGNALRVLKGHSGRVRACAVTPDGRRAVSASRDKTLRLWDLETGEALRVLEGHTDEVTACAVTPDGRRTVSSSWDRTLRVWNLETGETVRVLKGHAGQVAACAITPDDRGAVSGSRDGTLRVWDLETGEALRVLVGHTREVLACAITPDGRRVVSGSRDGTLRVWDLATGICEAIVFGPTSFIAIGVTPTVIVAECGKNVWVLDLPPRHPSAKAPARPPNASKAGPASPEETLAALGPGGRALDPRSTMPAVPVMPSVARLADSLLREVHAAAVATRLDPDTLTAGLDRRLTSRIRTAPSLSDRLWETLTELNHLALTDPEPLRHWLATAEHLSTPYSEAATFARALAALTQPAAPGAPATTSGPHASPSASAHQADVAIITALREEYDEALRVDSGALPGSSWAFDQVGGFEVAFRTYSGDGGRPLRVALTWAPRMRTTSAADTAGRLVDALHARCVAMSGVCAGRRGAVQPGNVIIGSLVYTYDAGALHVELDEEGRRHERFRAEPSPIPLDERWLQRAQGFAARAAGSWVAERPPTLAAQGDWVLDRLRAGDDPITHEGSKTRCPAWSGALRRLRKLGLVTAKGLPALTKRGSKHIEEVRLHHRGELPGAPPWKVHVAPIATGANVMRDPQLFDRLSIAMRTVLGVEMEAAAIGAIAHARGLPWVVMKGVMDHADDDKDDQLKPFAARASAECLIAFLREHLLLDGTEPLRRR